MNSIPVLPTPVQAPIDPRIRRRRIEVRRGEGRRRLRLLLAAVGLLTFTAVTSFALRSPLLDVDAIQVEGEARTSTDAVLRAAGIERGEAMIDLDGPSAVERIESLPWVARARVERRWPGTVSITVTERQAQAVARSEAGSWALVDRSGRVLEVVASRPPALVAVEGTSPPGPGQLMAGGEGALAVVARLSPELAAGLSAVAVVDGGGLELKINPHGTVRLGGPADIEAKLRAAETVLSQVDTRGLDTLDVRLPSSPVLTRG